MRIALISALYHSIAPISATFEREWPEPVLANILDTSLSADLARGHSLDSMTPRFLRLAHYAVDTGADAILFTCSAFGPCIEAVAAEFPNIPVLKPNEAMIEDAEIYGRVGLMATFGPSLNTLPAEFGRPIQIKLIDGALAALDVGDGPEHDRLAAEAAKSFSAECDVIALGQFSLARAADGIAAATGLPVLTTPGSAVKKLQRMLA